MDRLFRLLRHVTTEAAQSGSFAKTSNGVRDVWLGFVSIFVNGGVPIEATNREAMGRLVREVWVAFAEAQPNPKPSWLVPWDGLPEDQKEVDRRIGETLGTYTLCLAVTAASYMPKAKLLELVETLRQFAETKEANGG
jgi:hypothetical protein